jgi:hypothetical protein
MRFGVDDLDHGFLNRIAGLSSVLGESDEQQTRRRVASQASLQNANGFARRFYKIAHPLLQGRFEEALQKVQGIDFGAGIQEGFASLKKSGQAMIGGSLRNPLRWVSAAGKGLLKKLASPLAIGTSGLALLDFPPVIKDGLKAFSDAFMPGMVDSMSTGNVGGMFRSAVRGLGSDALAWGLGGLGTVGLLTLTGGAIAPLALAVSGIAGAVATSWFSSRVMLHLIPFSDEIAQVRSNQNSGLSVSESQEYEGLLREINKVS